MAEEDVAAAMQPKVIQNRDFGWAICEVKAGKRVCRRGWNGKGMNIHIIRAEREDMMDYIEMMTVQQTFIPWLASQMDMLAEDWEYAK